MKWLVSLIITALLTMLLLDAGVFEHERIAVTSYLANWLAGRPQLHVASRQDWGHASQDARIVVSTLSIIYGLYFAVKAFLDRLPSRWFTLDDGHLARLPDPRKLQDRVRMRQSRDRRTKELLHVANGRWMLLLSAILFVFLFAALPVVLQFRGYAWAWGLSLLLPVALCCCALNPDQPRTIVMSDREVAELLTPKKTPLQSVNGQSPTAGPAGVSPRTGRPLG